LHHRAWQRRQPDLVATPPRVGRQQRGSSLEQANAQGHHPTLGGGEQPGRSKSRR
jgi:hypothetical protein